MMRRRLTMLFFVGAMAVSLVAAAADSGSLIQAVALNAAVPYFVPTHPRITTTVRFPKEIGAPDGSVTVFTEDAAKQPGEYLVTWQQGDPYFTITPLKDSQMANLNVPYEGRTYVFVFYPVADPLKAAAVVNIGSVTAAPPTPSGAPPSVESAAEPNAIARQSTPLDMPLVPLTPARLVGFIDRLKLIHATPAGPRLATLARTMNVQVAIGRDELRAAGAPMMDDSIGELPRGTTPGGLYEIVLLRAVRDHRLNCVGFVCLVRNTSSRRLIFDVNSFGARAGAQYLSQRVSDAKPVLEPNEQGAAYFVVQPDRNTPLLATNDWRISVELASPRLSPGAAISSEFGGREPKP